VAVWWAYTDASKACNTLTDSEWFEAEYEVKAKYGSASLSTTIHTAFPYKQMVEISTEEAKCIKISWKTEDWGTNVNVGSSIETSMFSLEEVSFYGRLPIENAANCPRAVWTEMFFQPSEFNESCEVFKPVHGLSMNEFVRDEWSNKLYEEHKPYMQSTRSIILSPFCIGLALIGARFVFVVLGGMMQIVLIKMGLIR